MKFVCIYLFSLLLPQLIFSQSIEETPFLSLGKQTITIGEFERIFNKNNSLSTTDKQTVEEYLQMFINFKLKVEAAMDAGYDTLPSFKSELKGYRDQLAKTYLTDNTTVDSLLREAYQRMHTEVNASHIMVALKPNAIPSDTLRAWDKIMEIRKRILNGESFDKLASELSDDPSAKNNKGNLGYFTAFQMVYPFESAAYNTKIGDISMPVRSRFGYHLVKTLDKRPARGEVKIAHIMLKVPLGAPDSLWASAEKKIKEIQSNLKQGADFATLAKNQSEDRGSAANGGELPAFTSGRGVPEFDEAAFKLKFPGDISGPVRTIYGWHLIKLIDKKGIPEFEKVKQDLKSRIARDERANAGINSFILKLKNQYNFSENKSLLKQLYLIPKPVEIAATNSTYKKNKTVNNLKSNSFSNTTVSYEPTGINWNIDNVFSQNDLFHFADQTYKFAGFVSYLKTLQIPDSTVGVENHISGSYSDYVKNTLLSYEDDQLEHKYPDFKNLVQEYHDGILLFNLSDSLIWSKASKDTIGLKKFYQDNEASYAWPERVEATIISCRSMEAAKAAFITSKKLKTAERIESDMVKLICDSARGENCLTLEHNKFSKGDNAFIDSIEWKTGYTKITSKGGIYQFAIIHKKINPSPKMLDEARGLVISDYQNYLENQWVEKLRQLYPVTVNEDVLNHLKNKYAIKN